MRNFLKDQKGINLTTLAIAVIVILILTSIILYNVKDNLGIQNLKSMQTDIENLRDKVSSYYNQYGKIPANTEVAYTNIEKIKDAGVISAVVDTEGKFYVIDLSAMENVTLTYGKEYEEIKNGKATTAEQVNALEDLYIINEDSHNIFYVKGITLDGEKFYTDYTREDIDKKAIELKYVDNIKIPNGYTYVSGNKETGIMIKSSIDESKTYTWILVEKEITQIPEGLVVEDQEEFFNSTNQFKGYYKSNTDNTIIYLPLDEDWSPTYDKSAIYKDINEDIANIPQGFQVSRTPGENTINDGLVIRNATTDDRYVWIPVSKNVFKTVTSENDYEGIEKDLKVYTMDYIEDGYTDAYYDECGIENELKYKEQKNAMLRSIYKNEGFWISQYEMKTETERTSTSTALTNAVSKRGLYAYNYVTVKEAQQLATNLNSGDYTSSLLYGIQWDLVLKYIEATVLTEKNNVLNIYDLAGNIDEWTLEKNMIDNAEPCVSRGGIFNDSNKYVASERSGKNVSDSMDNIGFRVTLY